LLVLSYFGGVLPVTRDLQACCEVISVALFIHANCI
jgi:hypothetical protein